MPDFVDSPWEALASLRRGWGIAGGVEGGKSRRRRKTGNWDWHAKFKTIAFKLKNNQNITS